MSTRFEAEAIIRAAASGAIPSPGDTLVRTETGWIFSGAPTGSGGGGTPMNPDDVTFLDLIGFIQDSQVPESAVTQHEAALAISFTQMIDQIADDQVPESAVVQYLGDILLELRRLAQQDDFLFALTRRRSAAEKLYLAENYV